MADISNPAKGDLVSQLWTDCCLDEFFHQGPFVIGTQQRDPARRLVLLSLTSSRNRGVGNYFIILAVKNKNSSSIEYFSNNVANEYRAYVRLANQVVYDYFKPSPKKVALC